MARSILPEEKIHPAVREKVASHGADILKEVRRLALKMWTGWPTFPMVFVKGVLIGGASDLAKLIESGELPRKR